MCVTVFLCFQFGGGVGAGEEIIVVRRENRIVEIVLFGTGNELIQLLQMEGGSSESLPRLRNSRLVSLEQGAYIFGYADRSYYLLFKVTLLNGKNGFVTIIACG